MAIEIKKADFDRYGVERRQKVLHACFFAPHLNAVAIRLFHKDSDEYTDLAIPNEYFYGDIAAVDVYDSENFDAYLFVIDGVCSLDKYAYCFSLDKKKCIILPACKGRKSSLLKPFVPFDKECIYLASIKGQTMLDNKVKVNKGTFSAFLKRADSLKEYGITSVELMPVYENIPNECDDYRLDKKQKEKPNFWGFGNGAHFAIKRELCITDNSRNEFLSFVETMHSKDLEVILIMQFDDNENAEYILDVLKYYVFTFGVDGFRLVGSNIPYVEIINNPLFSDKKLIVEDYSFAGFKPMNIKRYKNLAFQSRTYMNNVKRFAKGDEDFVSYISFAIRENSKYYSSIRNIDDFHGFTLFDIVSYNEKHNELNCEENTDGTDYNYSWNCGIEGPSKKKNILKLRHRQVRNLFLLMILSQGVPVIKAGDEWLNTQFGNNNPYCQDNETGWVKFSKERYAKEFNAFVKNAMAFRNRHVILHQPKELMLSDYISCKVPDVSYHGAEAFKLEQNPTSRAFAVLFAGDYAKQYKGKSEPSIYITFNMHWEEKEFALPGINRSKEWKLLYSTDGSTDESFNENAELKIYKDKYTASARSISIFVL